MSQAFRFSVAAGDDSTSIRDIAVQVVPPPAMKSLAIRLNAPQYTGLPTQLLAPGLTQFRALEGTRLELEGLANKPLAHAELRRGDSPAGIPLTCEESGARFKITLAVSGNFTFWFDLKDTEGFRNREAVRYDVRGFRDEAPRVVLDEPKTDRDVPSGATIPIRVSLDDDFGLHSSRLIYRLATGDSEPHAEVAIPLWTAHPKNTSRELSASSSTKRSCTNGSWNHSSSPWGRSSRSMPTPAISTRSRALTLARVAKYACESFPRKTRLASLKTRNGSFLRA